MDSIIYKEELKSFHNQRNVSPSNITNSQDENQVQLEVAIVTICLTHSHSDCRQKYVDSTGKFSLKCVCPCHNKKGDAG